MNTLETLNFNTAFAQLGAAFSVRQSPTPLSNAKLGGFNAAVASLIDLCPQESKRLDFVEYFTGVKPLPGIDPIATCYSGHQFGHYVPRLGDGRALLLGEIVNQRGQRWEIQTKGSGPTPFSRQGDGRAVLRSSLREYLCSEAMHGLGIPTTRALCLIHSDTPVYRETIETGALLVRVAPSHVRFGSFEYFFYTDQYHHLQTLVDYLIGAHYPELPENENKYLALLESIVSKTAGLIAKWQAVGFCHGVMNTDNMSMLGLTLDYGPFGFIDQYDPEFICNHSDHTGRYAFNQQPTIGLWNLTALAQSLTPFLDIEQAKSALAQYETHYMAAYSQQMHHKLGLQETTPETAALLNKLLTLLAKNQVDYSYFFRQLSQYGTEQLPLATALHDLFIDRENFHQWIINYQAQLRHENQADPLRLQAMNQINPKYVLRNYLAQMAISAAQNNNDFTVMEDILKVVSEPFLEHPTLDHYAALPPAWATAIEVSCSS